MERSRISPSELRRELSHHALVFARSNRCLYETSDGAVPSVVFGVDDLGRHGNFHPASYSAICANPAWARRLEKIHTASKRQRLRSNWRWRELDCAHSSDALLMNVFCHPETLAGIQTRLLLGVDAECRPVFGFKPRTLLKLGKKDATEVDLRLGQLLIEAKLTEGDFQNASPRLVERYQDIEEVFGDLESSSLQLKDGKHSGYQLIRGTLAAHATNASFCVLCDGRRSDLVDEWYRVISAVRSAELRSRLKLLTWQELAATLPGDLQDFLRLKYGYLSFGGAGQDRTGA
jgi:hypothetical protein